MDKRKILISFGLFFIFFIYYMTAAIINTPTFKNIASNIILGMPLGLFLSLMVFPVSWILIFLFIKLSNMGEE